MYALALIIIIKIPVAIGNGAFRNLSELIARLALAC